MGWQKIISLIFLLIIISTLTFAFFPNFKDSLNKIDNGIKNINKQTPENLPDVDNISKEIQFIPEIRFNHNNISYKYGPDCEKRKEKMDEAFKIIEDKTEKISFYEVNKNEDIKITCSNENLSNEKGVFLAGEGGPNKIINLSFNPLILHGGIILYGKKHEKSCEKPIVEIHELLHVFGFNHQNNKSLIMYPYYHCEQKIPKNILNKLNEIYSKEPTAELYFTKINVTKHKNYLDYNLEIKNEGLLTAKDILLKIITLDEKLEEIEIAPLKPGSITTYTVKNQKLQSEKINEVSFKISTTTKELFKEDNTKTLKL